MQEQPFDPMAGFRANGFGGSVKRNRAAKRAGEIGEAPANPRGVVRKPKPDEVGRRRIKNKRAGVSRRRNR